MMPYTPPNFQEKAFNCPHCGAYAKQLWAEACRLIDTDHRGDVQYLDLATCTHCQKDSVWLDGRMLSPHGGAAPLPNPDLSQDITTDYDEARSIVSQSPRGAAALLRLAIQKLSIELGGKGKDLNADIGELVQRGLPTKIQQSLDIVRVIGNNAVHPGQIDLKDDEETASELFGLVNIIAQVMISQPKDVERLYGNLPEAQRKAIEKRDTSN